MQGVKGGQGSRCLDVIDGVSSHREIQVAAPTLEASIYLDGSGGPHLGYARADGPHALEAPLRTPAQEWRHLVKLNVMLCLARDSAQYR